MTASELVNLIGARGILTVEDRRGDAGRLGIEVEIVDARETFGRIDVLVRPMAGTGQQWVSAERVRVTG